MNDSDSTSSEQAPDQPSDQPPTQAAGQVEVTGAYFAELPVSQVSPNSRQPRQVFEEGAMAELVHSVKEVGLLQPVVVRRTGDSAYELIMGERRWRAIQEAGLDTIPAIVRDTDDDDMLRDALLENLHRSQLNPLEEADEQSRARPARPTAPGLAELGDRLSDRLDTRVKVTLGRSKGKVSIEFASLTDLERIVNVIDPRNRDDRPV